MNVGVMQPYFAPYVGYFQLINAVDEFVVYDNIQYTKKGWINRNRILINGEPVAITIPLRKASDYLFVRDRELASDFDGNKILRRIDGAYRRAPYFDETRELLADIFLFPETNLYLWLRNSVEKFCAGLDITTPLLTSSEVPIDHSLKGESKVLAFCETLGATHYLNPQGGRELYSNESFMQRGIELKFLVTRDEEYPQLSASFHPKMSIIDVLFSQGLVGARDMLQQYDLLGETGKTNG